MIIKSVKVKCKGKGITKGISKTTGKEYENKQVYFEDTDGTILTMSFNNDIVYNKAEENKLYLLKYYIAPNGKISLNDIEGA